MAIVRHLEHLPLQVEARHTEARASYSMVKGKDGEPFLQINTYGSSDREVKDTTSQTLRLSEDAALELAEIIEKNFGRHK